jgi:hypothetical protein
MTALTALSQNYPSRGNCPVGSDNTTALLLAQKQIWMLKESLLGTLTLGTAGAISRSAGSLWTCVGSSDGSGAGAALDGVDRWTSTFDASKLVGNTSGSNHSWIVLQNTTIGLQMVIDLNNTTGGSWAITFTKTSTPFLIGGSPNTTRPQTTANTEEWSLGIASAPNASSTIQFYGDLATLNTNYCHFVHGDDGSWYAYASRSSGGGIFSSFMALVKGVGGNAGDTRNIWALHSSLASGRGAGNDMYSSAARAVRRPPDNSHPASQAGIRSVAYAGTDWGMSSGKGVNYPTSEFPAWEVEVAVTGTTADSTRASRCGVLTDLYMCGNETVGASVPSTGAQQRIVAGNLIAPFDTVIPIIN